MKIILMGVSGSGKTTVGKLLAADTGFEFIDADDFHPPENIAKMKRGNALTDDDRLPWFENLKKELLVREDIVMACSALKQSYRDILDVDESVRFVYLSGSFKLIRDRLKQRSGHFMNPDLLQSQFDALEAPNEGFEVDISETPSTIIQIVRKELKI